MSHWDLIRSRARGARAHALSEAQGNERAEALLAAADRLTGIKRVGLPHGDALLDGAQSALDLDIKYIWFDNTVESTLALFYQAHEYAHFWLHTERSVCDDTDINPNAEDDDIPLGVDRVEGYGPRERHEREANVFAREFLLPLAVARKWYLNEALRTPAIVSRTGLPESVVLHQLARGVLVPETSETDTEPPAAEEAALDESQRAAAQATRGPMLVDAGPGTGKTRTLCGRITHLLRQGVRPSAILALTFSNKAAEEMRERVAKSRPDVASAIWMGTFHAYGLELLRKYGDRIGIPASPEVLDPADAVAVLESRLTELNLVHFQYLPEPARDLRHIVAAISRAKDDLIDPTLYAAFAEKMRSTAASDEDHEAAAKAMEVANVYRIYQDTLTAENLLDFGDLIFRTVHLLREHSEVRDEVRRQHAHVLVDEYQDVNRASALFLKELVGGGAGLWVVGDARQSIYRFRGASPENIREFRRDFPGAKTLPLERNYRSASRILRVVSAFGSQMPDSAGGDGFSGWVPDRQVSGEVAMEIADGPAGEAEGIARLIQQQRSRGILFRQQAVLCRSHTWLGRVAEALEKADIPTFYLGDLFERAEVRDMLALVSLTSEGDGRGLIRVARYPEYQIPLDDVLTLFRLARENNKFFPEALSLAQDSTEISSSGKAALARLASHISDVHFGTKPWSLLSSYLFTHSSYLGSLLLAHDVRSQQRRLALYQFLRFAIEHRVKRDRSGRIDPKRSFLGQVRWLEDLGEEKQLRQMPNWASGVDAVRMLTVHGSKGLEFNTVFMPALSVGVFPASPQWRPCPPPAGMVTPSSEQHLDEETCLFFVALSRATDFLCLSRPTHSATGRTSNPSPLLNAIRAELPWPPDGAVTWSTNATGSEPTPAANRQSGRDFSVEELDRYLRCPREYFYRHVLEVRAASDAAAYVQFHRGVYALLRWLAEQHAVGRQPDTTEALEHLGQIWKELKLEGHPYEGLYRAIAQSMVGRAASRRRAGIRVPSPQWRLPLRNGTILLQPDDLERLRDGQEVVERVRTGRPTKDDRRGKFDDIYAVYVAAAEQAEPRVSRGVQVRFLSTDEVLAVSLSSKELKTRLDHYDKAMSGIASQEFAPKPNEHRCPRCSFYFICPVAEE